VILIKNQSGLELGIILSIENDKEQNFIGTRSKNIYKKYKKLDKI
jgi:hypothetical protein